MKPPSLGRADEPDVPKQQDVGAANQTDFSEQQQQLMQQLQQQQQANWLKYCAMIILIVILAYVVGKLS